MADTNRERLIALASWWSGWCVDYDDDVPGLPALSDFLLDVKHQMALDRDCPSAVHHPAAKPVSAQSHTDTRSDTRGPQMGAQRDEEER